MGIKLKPFLDGFASVFSFLPSSNEWRANYIKPIKNADYVYPVVRQNGIATDMQKVLHVDLGNAINKIQDHMPDVNKLSEEERLSLQKISDLQRGVENFYADGKKNYQ